MSIRVNLRRIFCFCPKECSTLHWWAKQNDVYNKRCQQVYKFLFKNQEYHLFLPKGMQHTALVGKTNGQRRSACSAVQWTRRRRYSLGFKDQGVGTRETGHRRAQWKNIYSAGNQRELDRWRRQVPQYNWGLMDKETRIPECIRDNKHRSACKNAYEMHNCQSNFSGQGTTFLENESTFLGKQVTLLGKQILINSTFWSRGVLRLFLGSSLVSPWSLIRERLARYKGRES